MADHRDAWSEDISDRVLDLERSVGRWRWLTLMLAVVVVLQLGKDDDLPLALRTTLLVGLIVMTIVVVAFRMLERRFPPTTPTN